MTEAGQILSSRNSLLWVIQVETDLSLKHPHRLGPRSNNDLRDWLDEGGARLPKGDHGAGAWMNDPATVKRVRELYKPSSVMRPKMESDRRIFLAATAKINEGMILGVDKNTYVEPIVWTTEWAQKHYKYPVARSN